MNHRINVFTLAAAGLLVMAPLAQAQNTNTNSNTHTDALAEAIQPRVIEWRRHIHQHPELSYQEVKTAAYIVEQLRAIGGYDIQTGIGKTGVKAVLKGGKPGPVVALRADMDALPVTERNDLPFKSTVKTMWQGAQTGVMHACGHDTHVAMLLGAASIFSKLQAELPGTVVLLFQPAEEGGTPGEPSGAPAMVAAGAMDNPKVDAVFGQHIGAGYPAGRISYRFGGTMASADTFTIQVKGVGGHGASPWQTKDPIVAAAQIVTSLQTVVSRQVNLTSGAAVVTVGEIHSGNRANIIPETTLLRGTIRTLNEPTRGRIHEAITLMATKTAEASGLTAEVTIDRSYPVLNNDGGLGAKVLGALEAAAGSAKVQEIPPTMGSEDFGAFGSKAPSFFWFLSASPRPDMGGAPNHSPLFQIDEKYMVVGVKALVNVAMGYMGGGKK